MLWHRLRHIQGALQQNLEYKIQLKAAVKYGSEVWVLNKTMATPRSSSEIWQ
jgi:hypothetical protein